MPTETNRVTFGVHWENAAETTSNLLMAALPEVDRERLLSACRSVELPLSELLCERDELTAEVYFPTRAFVSLISLADARAGVELGMIGREGMLGSHLCLNVFKSPLRGVVQGQGHAWRIPTDEFIDHMQRSPALRGLMQRYQYFLTGQQATSAACLRFHQVDQRLARWLLMSDDRAPGSFLQMTQEFVAYMLGVRRVGTSVATSSLVREGLIDYRHGQIRLLDRDRLQHVACSCYEADRRSYDALFGGSHEQDRRASEDREPAIVPPQSSDVPERVHHDGIVGRD